MRENKNRVVVLSLIAVIVLLLGFVGYIFLIRPSLTGLAVSGWNQGQQYTILTIAQQAAQCQQVPLTVGNQTINLIALECPGVTQCLQQCSQQAQPTQ